MNSDSTKTRYGRWTITFAVLTALVGIGLSVQIRSRIAQSETNAARLTAETLKLNTEQELNLFVEVLESVRALHTLSGAIDQAAMDEFIEKGLVHQQTVLGSFGLAQRVTQKMRVDIEKKPQPAPGAYTIVERGTDKPWVPAKTHPVYYPLTWQIHANALHIPVGYDFASEPEANRVIAGIERTRHTVVNRTPLPDTHPTGYWVFSPVIPRGAPNRVIGLAVAILYPENILKKVSTLSALSPKLHLMPTLRRPETTIQLKNNAWYYSSPLEAIGTIWTFKCSLPVNGSDRRSTAVFIAGLVITGLMTTLLLILAGRTRSIETEVLTRTEELRVANIQLEENLHERARMEEEMNELAARERRRIGRDLHDSLGQKLTGAVFLSRSLLDHFKAESQKSKVEGQQSPSSNNQQPATGNPQLSHAKTLNETLKSSVSQVRNMARGLASVTLNDESLEESLDQLVEEMNSLYEVSCTLTQTGQLPTLDRKAKEQLYFIAREAVNNAARHAQAEHITIRLDSSKSEWTLRVQDDGKGFPSDQITDEGMGLRTMRHRAGQLGAKFTIQSTQSGTCIKITKHV